MLAARERLRCSSELQLYSAVLLLIDSRVEALSGDVVAILIFGFGRSGLGPAMREFFH